MAVSPSSRVRLLPLGSSPFAVHLLRVESGEPGADPFLRAGGRDAGVRAYLAVLASETGAVLDRLVVELPGDDPGDAPFPEEEPLSNVAVEAEWAAAHRDLQRLLAAPAHFPELVAPAEPGLLPPTLFCAMSGRLFRIPCPACFAPLRTCRDDALLAAAGLPLYSATSTRFLYCPDCASSEAPRFWVGTEAEARGLERVGTLEDLRREYETSLAQAGTARPDLPPPAPAAGKKGAAPPPAPGWAAFNLHDAPFLVTRLAPVGFDEFLARLGGMAAETGSSAEEGPGFLFAAEGSGIDAVEVLALKLAAFLQIVAAVRRHYLLLGRPHLDLQPEHLVVEPGLEAGFLPTLWSFRVKLLGASPARLAALGPGLAVPLPPRDPRAPFASPAIRAARLASPATAELMIERVAAEKGDRWRIEGTLLDPHGFFPPPTPRDWIQLVWPRDPFGSARPAAARLDPRSAADSVEMAITTEPLELDPALAQRLGRAGGFRLPGVRYKIYPALSAPEDLYSLGVLLLRMLLVNDGQTLSALEPLIEAVPQGAGQGVRGSRRTVEEAWSAMLADEPQRLAKANLFHRESDRGPGRPNSIPEEIWKDTILFALRLVGRGPDFGLTPERNGSFAFNETNPVAHLDAVQAGAEDLLRRLHGLLFHRQAVHVEVQTLLAELLAEEVEQDGTRGPTDRIKP